MREVTDPGILKEFDAIAPGKPVTDPTILKEFGIEPEPSLAGRVKNFATDLWDQARGVVEDVRKADKIETPVDHIRPPDTGIQPFAVSPPGMSKDQERYDMFVLDNLSKKGDTAKLDTHLRQMEARGYKINRPSPPTQPTITDTSPEKLVTPRIDQTPYDLTPGASVTSDEKKAVPEFVPGAPSTGPIGPFQKGPAVDVRGIAQPKSPYESDVNKLLIRSHTRPKPEPILKAGKAEDLPFAGEIVRALNEYLHPREEKAARAQIAVEAHKEGLTSEAYKEKVYPEGVSLADRAGKGFSSGVLGTTAGTLGAAEWVFKSKQAKSAADEFERWSAELVPEDPTFFDQVASGTGSMAVFFVPGMGAARGLTTIAKVAPRLALWGGSSVMAATEAMTEAGSVYRDVYRGTNSDEKASAAASKTFWMNMPLLVVTNKLGIFGEHGEAIKRVLSSGAMEGTQEMGQTIISSAASGKPVDSKELLSSGGVGAVVGALTGGAANVTMRDILGKRYRPPGKVLEAPEGTVPPGAPPPPSSFYAPPAPPAAPVAPKAETAPPSPPPGPIAPQAPTAAPWQEEERRVVAQEGPRERRSETRPSRLGTAEDQITDPAEVKSEINSVTWTISELEDEIAKRPESDTEGRSYLYEVLARNQASLKALETRKAEIEKGIEPKKVEITPVEGKVKKTAEEIAFEKARAERGAVPRSGEIPPAAAEGEGKAGIEPGKGAVPADVAPSTIGSESPEGILLLHGSKKKGLTSFRTDVRLPRGRVYPGDMGVWFTDGEKTAKHFSGTDGEIYKGHVKLENPLIFDDHADFIDEIKKYKSSLGYKRKLIKEGYDGIIIRNTYSDTGEMRNDYLAFRNNQIKLEGTPSVVEPPVPTPGQKFAKVRKQKISAQQKAMEQTPQARVRKGGGIKWTEDIAGEIRTYASRKEGGNKATSLQMLFRRQDKNPKGYAGAMAWDKWIQTFQEDGTLPADAGIGDLFELLLENKPGKGAGVVKAGEITAETAPTEEHLAKIEAEADKLQAEAEKKAAEYAVTEAKKKAEAAKAEEERLKKVAAQRDAEEAAGVGEPGADVDEDGDVLEAPKGEPFTLEKQESPVKDEPLIPEMAGEQPEMPGMEGQRSKYRAPEKGKPAPLPEDGLFGKKEGAEPTAEDIVDVPGMGGDEMGFAPEKDFRKQPQAPVDTDKPMKRSDIIKFIAEKFDVPIRIGRFRAALGIFKVKSGVIRIRFAKDIEVAAHEIGHALHKFLWPDARTTSGGLAAGPLRQFQDELIPIATKPRAGGSKTAEGYAEFIRKYVVNPDEALRVAPKFHKFFEQRLDENAPDVKAILLKVRADYKRYLEQPPLARVMGNISSTPELKAKLSGGELYTALVDALYPLEQVVKEMAKVTKIDQVPSRWNAYKLAHLMAGWKGKADAWLEYKPFRFKTYKFSGAVKSYREIMLPIKENRDKFDAYLVSRRSVKVGQDKSGILDSDARTVIEQMEKEHPEFKQAALDLKHYQNALLRYLYDGGVINAEQFFNMRESNEDYVPYYRVMDYETSGGWGKTGYEVSRTPIHRFKGSWRDIVSPTESIIKNTYAFINAVEKNAVGKALVDLANQSEDTGKYVEKIPADTQRIAVKDTELEEMLRKYGKWTETTQFTTTNQAIRETITETGDAGEAVPPDERGTRIMKERAIEALKTRGYSEAESRTIVDRIARATNTTARNRIVERVIERATVRATVREFGIEIPEGLAYIYRPSKQTPRGNVITVMIKGKPTFFEVDPRIYKAFHALDRETANSVIKIMAVPARLLRAGATLTPEFALGKNPLRDQFTAYINSKYGYKPHFDFPRGLFSAFGRDADYWRWKIGGGEHSAMVSMDRDYFDKTWKEVMRKHGLKENALFVVEHPIDMIRAVSEFTESGTRIGEFKAGLRQMGVSKESIQESAYGAREVTLPFSRMGTVIKPWNMITAFMNANIADLDKIHRQFKEYPQQTTVRLIASITIPSILLAIATHDDKDIKEVAQWQKDIFWIFPTGRVWTSGPWKGSQVLIRYPKPFVLGTLFGSFPERIVRYILNKDPHALDGFAKSLTQGVIPPILPTGIIPPIENWANRTMFSDRKIVPMSRERVNLEYKYQPYTTELAKKIGSLLAKLPGMDPQSVIAQQIVPPANIENLVRGYTGGLGMWALHAADKGLQLAGIIPKRVEPTKALSDYPLIKAFVVRYPTADVESVKRFFDDYTEAEKNINSAKLMLKRGDIKEGLEIISKTEIIKLEEFKNALTKSHQLVNSIYENPGIKPEEKRQLIDKIYLDMAVIARAGNEVMDVIKSKKEHK